MLSNSGVTVARAGVGAGVTVLVRAAIKASPGLVKQEIKGDVHINGDVVTGEAGLMVLPQKGQPIVNGIRPHGLFLEKGTKFMAARHFVANSLRSAIPKAISAMRRAAKRRLERLARGK